MGAVLRKAFILEETKFKRTCFCVTFWSTFLGLLPPAVHNAHIYPRGHGDTYAKRNRSSVNSYLTREKLDGQSCSRLTVVVWKIDTITQL